MKSLKTINISDAEALDNLDGLKGCDALEEVKIDGSNYSGNKKIKQHNNVLAKCLIKSLITFNTLTNHS